MLIVVKERTKEIGIRKAVGAQPLAIVGMILHESIFVTAVAGLAGLIFSMGLLEIVGPNVEVDYVLNPSVNFSIALTMVIILIIAGFLKIIGQLIKLSYKEMLSADTAFFDTAREKLGDLLFSIEDFFGIEYIQGENFLVDFLQRDQVVNNFGYAFKYLSLR